MRVRSPVAGSLTISNGVTSLMVSDTTRKNEPLVVRGGRYYVWFLLAGVEHE
jgi:hypothetical protein